MSTALSVKIRHELPVRLRLELSHPLVDVKTFSVMLRSHHGIAPVSYTPAVRSLLLSFDPLKIRKEELLVRVALCLSLQYNQRPVRIEHGFPTETLTLSVAISGILLLAAAACRATGFHANRYRKLDRLAGLATGSAVLSHASQELRRRGAYHPEVASAAFLMVGMLRGNAFRAAILTWFTAFGRHLLEPLGQTLEVRPNVGDVHGEVEAAIVPDTGWQSVLRLLPELMRDLSGASRSHENLMEKLQDVTRLHDQVLDSLGPWNKGVTLRFETEQRKE